MRHGYQRCSRFGDYAVDPHCLFLMKTVPVFHDGQALSARAGRHRRFPPHSAIVPGD